MEKSHIGAFGESAVANYLEKKGFKILSRNYRQRCGEVDLIVGRGDLISFIEIKTRTTEYFPTSLVVTRSKQQKVAKTAQYFCLQNRISNKILRFDVAIVVGTPTHYDVRYLENAFTATSTTLY